MPLHSRRAITANDSTTDILYQLGMTQESGTETRVRALADWLGDSARVALQVAHSGTIVTVSMATPAPVHIHCIAAILWHSQEMPVSYNIRGLVSRELLRYATLE